MNFISAHHCPYCDIPQNQYTDHDHFIQCNSLRNEKQKWIETLRIALSKSFTPPNLRDAILDRVYNYYDSNLRETNKVNFDENHSYDSRSNSEERTGYPHSKRRVIDQDSIVNSEEAESNSEPSNESNQPKPRRRLISRRDSNSSESEEECYALASIPSTENSDQILLEPFHQDLSLQKKRTTSTTSISSQKRGDLTSIVSKENPKPLLIEPFRQDLDIPTKKNDSNISNFMQAIGGEYQYLHQQHQPCIMILAKKKAELLFPNNGNEVELEDKTSTEIEQMKEETERLTTRHTPRIQSTVTYHHTLK